VTSLAFTGDRSPPKKVIVTGAAGRTGSIIFSSLVQDSHYDPVGLVRTERKAKKIFKNSHCGLDQMCVCDVTKLDEGFPKGLDGAEAMIICTSAKPKISKLSIVYQILCIPLNIVTRKKSFNFRGLRFWYASGQSPEKVDYEGQIAQIQLAIELGISHIVLVSSMGGTDPNNFLNSIGKNKDGTGDGDILIWKRKAEQYLIASGLEYTIIHPGLLNDGIGGISEIMLDIDDELMKNEERSISRSDLAMLCIASLTIGKGKNVSFDCTASEYKEETDIKHATLLLDGFILSGKTCTYQL